MTIYFVLILYMQTPPAAGVIVEEYVDTRTECQERADYHRAINRPEQGRFVTWYECRVMGLIETKK